MAGTYRDQVDELTRELSRERSALEDFKELVVSEVESYLDDRDMSNQLLENLGLSPSPRDLTWSLTYTISVSVVLSGDLADEANHPKDWDEWLRRNVDLKQFRGNVDSHTDNYLFDSDVKSTICSRPDVGVSFDEVEEDDGDWTLRFSLKAEVSGESTLTTSAEPGSDLTEWLDQSISDDGVSLDDVFGSELSEYEVDEAEVDIKDADWS